MPEERLDRRSFLAGAAGVATAAAQTPDARQRPNILHIMTDQQQWATIAIAWRARDCSSSEATRRPRSAVRHAPCC